MPRRMPVDVDELVEEVLADDVQACIVRGLGPILPEDHRKFELPAVIAEQFLASVE